VALDAASPPALRPQGSIPPAHPPKLPSALLDWAAAGLAASDSMTSAVGRASRRTVPRPVSAAPGKHKVQGKAVCLLFIVAGWNRRRQVGQQVCGEPSL